MLAADPVLQIGIARNFIQDWLISIWWGSQGTCRWSCHFFHQWPLRTDEFADAVPLPAGANEHFTIWVILVLPQENFKAILLSGNIDLHKFVKALAFLVYIQSRIQEIMQFIFKQENKKSCMHYQIPLNIIPFVPLKLKKQHLNCKYLIFERIRSAEKVYKYSFINT